VGVRKVCQRKRQALVGCLSSRSRLSGIRIEWNGKNCAARWRFSTAAHLQTERTFGFYSMVNSITQQAWWKEVEKYLRATYTNANLTIENRAIGGHSSQLLVKTAEADLYPFRPDLVIFMFTDRIRTTRRSSAMCESGLAQTYFCTRIISRKIQH
jgi:hypothetical protein